MHRERSLALAASGVFRLTVLALLLLFVATAAATRAAARDVDALAQIVAPAYTAMNFAMVCREDDPWFLWDTRGPRGTALHYAEHVKDEVIASLGYDEAVAVLRRAADAARATAREALRKTSPDYPDRQPSEIIAWCRGAASNFIRAFMERHDDIHETLLQEIEQAKQ